VQTSGGLTATLDRLEERGLVTRAVDDADGRARRVRPTAAGRRFVRRVLRDLVARYDEVLAGVDREAAAVAVADLLGALEAEAGHRSSRVWRYTPR
jgi:DNA-binding MarR family transcriptional regulator